MASFKDTFEAHSYAANSFAAGAWRGTGVAVAAPVATGGPRFDVRIHPTKKPAQVKHSITAYAASISLSLIVLAPTVYTTHHVSVDVEARGISLGMSTRGAYIEGDSIGVVRCCTDPTGWLPDIIKRDDAMLTIVALYGA